jgi:hypothetical protein
MMRLVNFGESLWILKLGVGNRLWHGLVLVAQYWIFWIGKCHFFFRKRIWAYKQLIFFLFPGHLTMV